MGSDQQLGALIDIKPKKLHWVNNSGFADSQNRKANAAKQNREDAMEGQVQHQVYNTTTQNSFDNQSMVIMGSEKIMI